MRHFFASARRRRLILNLVGLALIAVLVIVALDAPPVITASPAGATQPVQ